MNKKPKLFLLLAIALLSLASCSKGKFDRPDYYNTEANSALAKSIVEGSEPYIGHIKSEKTTKVASGVEILELAYLNSKGHATQMFVYSVSLKASGVTITSPVAPAKTQLLSEQCMQLDEQGHYTVLGAVAASTALGADFNFVALNNGKVAILSKEELLLASGIECGVGSAVQVVENGYVIRSNDATESARTAVGVSEDGAKMWLVCVDGGDFYYSSGISYSDLALVLQACGAYNAVVISSGATSTFVWRNKLSQTLFEVLNKPSNKGNEAATAFGLAIVQ